MTITITKRAYSTITLKWNDLNRRYSPLGKGNNSPAAETRTFNIVIVVNKTELKMLPSVYKTALYNGR
jgi:hypothetical protein